MVHCEGIQQEVPQPRPTDTTHRGAEHRVEEEPALLLRGTGSVSMQGDTGWSRGGFRIQIQTQASSRNARSPRRTTAGMPRGEAPPHARLPQPQKRPGGESTNEKSSPRRIHALVHGVEGRPSEIPLPRWRGVSESPGPHGGCPRPSCRPRKPARPGAGGKSCDDTPSIIFASVGSQHTRIDCEVAVTTWLDPWPGGPPPQALPPARSVPVACRAPAAVSNACQ